MIVKAIKIALRAIPILFAAFTLSVKETHAALKYQLQPKAQLPTRLELLQG